MSDERLRKQIADFFVRTGHAHHQAFLETDGADPDWPLWYADYMREELAKLLNAEFTRSELTYLLVRLDKERAFNAPGSYWPDYYAKQLLNWYL
ncbi:MAG: hypothetical protein HF973_14465 [Chloroflexi bacterium]|nr:hypothetical protein [Chloroflexota bacterium]